MTTVNGSHTIVERSSGSASHAGGLYGSAPNIVSVEGHSHSHKSVTVAWEEDVEGLGIRRHEIPLAVVAAAAK